MKHTMKRWRLMLKNKYNESILPNNPMADMDLQICSTIAKLNKIDIMNRQIVMWLRKVGYFATWILKLLN